MSRRRQALAQRLTLATSALLALAAGAPLHAASPQGGAAPQGEVSTTVVRCGALYVGDGTVLEDATMVVQNGRVLAVGAGAGAPAVPSGARIVDVTGKTVMPGLVAADSDLAAGADERYGVTPDVVAVDGFDFAKRRLRWLEGGVTTAYLSPGRARLVSGQGSVVKLAGEDMMGRVLADSACLRIAMGGAALRAPAVFEPTAAPTSDDPLLPARQQAPTARISLLTELRELFETAVRSDRGSNGPLAAFSGTGAAEDRYSLEPLQRAARGDLRVRVAAARAGDLRRALRLAADLQLAMVLEDPWELHRLADAVRRQQALGAVFRLPVRVGGRNPGGEDRAQDEPERHLDAPAVAARAGLRVALATSRDQDAADFLWIAALAIRHGLTPTQAMRSVTADAAAVLGVADRVGTLTPGKDADFAVLSGEPFAVGTLVEQTWVEGTLAWERQASSSLLAVRCDRIETVAGQTFGNGVLLAADGKIKAVGEGLAVPYGARVVDVPGGVMVPGFVNAYCHVGLSGDGTGIPKGAADQRVGRVVDPSDPLLARAAQAGLTTVLVSGTDSSLVSGRVAALKTAAPDRDSLVLRETAALRFVHDAVGADAIKPLADAVARGRRYLKKWQDYEAKLAKKAKGEATDEDDEDEDETSTPKKADPITGTWKVELVDAPFPLQITLELELGEDGSTVTGTVVARFGSREMSTDVQDGKLEGDTLTASFTLMGPTEVTATVGEDSMSGSLQSPQGDQEFRATRTAKDGAAAGDDDEDGDGKPKVDESLEPLRALVEKKIPAVVRVDRAPAIRSVVEWFAEQELPLVLTGARDATRDPAVLGEQPPGVVLDPDVVQREDGAMLNAAANLTDHGVALALGTGDTAGARHLPLHMALAVRYGLDPTEALEALTLHPARLFQLDDRIGSLERGKDADFVVFSGSPFELTSRVLLVVVGGRVVVDQREQGR
ncbi:MAG: amidohydrolase family protein [Planctomycetota bacterium]